MDSAEVDKLVKEAEVKREEDKKRKESVESRNIAESSVYQAVSVVSDFSFFFVLFIGFSIDFSFFHHSVNI